MALDLDKIGSLKQRLTAEKTKWDKLYYDVFRYMMPDRFGETDNVNQRNVTSGQSNRELIFSSVGEQSADRFIQKIQDLLTPPAQEWMNVEVGYRRATENEGQNEADYQNNIFMNCKIANAFLLNSNFDTSITEFYGDLLAGTAVLRISEGNKEDPLLFSAVPIKDVYLEEGGNGNIRTIIIEQSLSKEDLNEIYGEENINYGDNEEYKNLDDLKPIQLYEVCRFDHKRKRWDYLITDRSFMHKFIEKEFVENPFVVFRWNKAAGETYGRGLGLKALADVKTLNRVIEFRLQGLAFMLPVFVASEEGGYNPDNFLLQPGVINPVPSTRTDAPTIQQLGVNANPDAGIYDTEKLEMNIKKVLLDNTIPNDPSRRTTAAEVNARVSDLKQATMTSFGRYLNEFLYPFHRRVFNILARKGYLKDIDDTPFDSRLLNGFDYRVKVNASVAISMSAGEAQSTMNFIQTTVALDPSGQTVWQILDKYRTLPYLADKFGVPTDLFYTTDDMLKAEEAQAQMQAQIQQAQQQQQVQNQMAVDTNKAVARANA